jgi:hypothetical protein
LTAFTQLGHRLKFDYDEQAPIIELDFFQIFNSLNLPCWHFLNAEPQRFEVIGARNQPITKVKIKGDKLLNGADELLRSDSPLVLDFLKYYLTQYENRGLTWINLLTEGKIPKTDADIQHLFTEHEQLKAEISQKIQKIRLVYNQLEKMVSQLYQN